MSKVLALARASWLEASSYRVKMLLTLVGLLAAAVPFFFVARALQPVMAESIKDEGGQYFGFLVLGMVTFAFLRTAVSALPDELTTAISTGTLEALLGTPTRLPVLLAGLVSYAFTWTAVRASVVLVFAWFMGMNLLWSRTPLGIAILVLIVVTHLSFGILAAALIVAFRASGPLQAGVIWVSTILGGVYYPTQVIPSWLEQISAFVPLTYGMRALRRTLLEPTLTASMLTADLVPLLAMAAVLIPVSVVALMQALRYARQAGTLAQY